MMAISSAVVSLINLFPLEADKVLADQPAWRNDPNRIHLVGSIPSADRAWK